MKVVLHQRFPHLNYLLTSLFLFFTLLSQADDNCGEIEYFEFSNGHEVASITDGGTYAQSELPMNFYFNTIVTDEIKRVYYKVENLDTHKTYTITENFKPYTFPAGGGAWHLGDGNFRITAKAFKSYLSTTPCDSKTITFRLAPPCSADAGTLTADMDKVVLANGSVTISATPNGDINVPYGYSKLFVLTSGEGLVIEQVGDMPEFTVDGAGLYTIHTLVYDGNADSANFLDLGIVKIGETTGVDVLTVVGNAGICASLDAAGAPVMVEACSADAGTLTADMDKVVLANGSATISATPNGDINVPYGYSKLFVLTSGEGLVIEQVGDMPEFTVDGAGLYTIHTLVYDGNAESANFLDLGIVKIGETTGVDVLTVVGNAGICASLDAAGAPVMVEACSADAGTLTADMDKVVLANESATISATPNGDINVPYGYSKLFVLTSGEGLVIEQVGDMPEFTVDGAGLYTIHTLVYDGNAESANFLDLGIVKIGETTGVDVLTVVGNAGICASLDAAGAPVMVEACSADAGTLTADMDKVVLANGSATISATPNGDINVPYGYSKLFVLTSGEGLVIEQVGDMPEFTVDGAGLYTIHTLVYDGNAESANFLDLGIVKIGETTGVDVLTVVGNAGICASLDAAGAPVMVEACSADAGTLTADMDKVVLANGSATISATPNGDINVPYGYSKLFVLTSGEGLVIEQVGDMPEFTVDGAGLYTIHTLVYDGNAESANFLDLGIVKIGETTGVDVLTVVGNAGICASLDAAGAPVMVEACSADAGTLTADMDKVVLANGSATISATPNGDINVPYGYSKLFVLTSGEGLVIEQVGDMPEFTVDGAGLYTIHTLVYDGNAESANFLDLGIVKIGETTGVDVLTVVGNAGICASLDAAGAPVMVEACSADAGTLTADMDKVVLANGSATISATPNGDINVPYGYSKLFVLTSGEALVIEQVGDMPEFTVDGAGLYTIHTLVYDGNAESANFLDLGIVKIGETTGVDVLTVVGNAGICASLDAAGAPVMVEACSADAGTLTADMDKVVLANESATISATPNGDINVPYGYSKLFVLTSGEGLVIEQVGDMPEFTVDGAGLYTIHTLVYDGNAESANFLDLGIVKIGETTGVDVLTVVGNAGICASLDAAGAPVMVEACSADAGTLTADMDKVVLANGSATISATPNGDINVPYGYSKLFVLTSGEGLVIEQVGDMPEFTVDGAGLYTIHTLVYDGNAESANFLDLGIVKIGETTGVDVLTVVGNAGICASLDAAGAPVMVEESGECLADAGTMYSSYPISCYEGGLTTIMAKAYDEPTIPDGYQQLYVLTEGFTLTILGVSDQPTFDVENSGLYRIHSLVYNPSTLDLSVVEIGVTTGYDVLNIVTSNNICASLDVHGAINVVIRSKWFCKYLGDLFNGRSVGLTMAELPANIEAVLSDDELEKFSDSKVRLFPNPVANRLTVNMAAFGDENVNYDVSDIGGRRILSGKLNLLDGGVVSINTNSLSNGVYLIRLNSQYRQITKRIVVEK
ncbi:T9SS type A sorting domain-containing protein [Seonamhaeicola sp. ML3]|uniref:T9SS type A sorting domain-containing protein n=1 Tax=Seonamhaeicola sp. ML3 TaxID=2937786 RepID=UPI002010842F|nr:T9SS type A sorting domain-containing protein [Seonamhaeicola sp. ML3]